MDLLERYKQLDEYSRQLSDNPNLKNVLEGLAFGIIEEWAEWANDSDINNKKTIEIEKQLKEAKKTVTDQNQFINDLKMSNNKLNTLNLTLENEKNALEQKIKRIKTDQQEDKKIAVLEEQSKKDREALTLQEQTISALKRSNDNLNSLFLTLKKENIALEQEIKQIKAEQQETTNNFIDEDLNRDEETGEPSRDLNSLLQTFHNPYREGQRGGCKLTDKQILRILKIYAKREKYAHMTLDRAIKSIAQTHRTYYKVIRRDYRSEATKERIAIDNDIKLPERGKIALNARVLESKI